MVPMSVKHLASRLSRNCPAPLWRVGTRLFVASLVCLAAAQEAERTGRETEKRFPPIKVPPQFKATLFACDPLIEYPSVLALGPRSNSIFLAHDYMTGLGEKIVRRDEVRLVEDMDGDGNMKVRKQSRQPAWTRKVTWRGSERRRRSNDAGGMEKRISRGN